MCEGKGRDGVMDLKMGIFSSTVCHQIPCCFLYRLKSNISFVPACYLCFVGFARYRSSFATLWHRKSGVLSLQDWLGQGFLLHSSISIKSLTPKLLTTLILALYFPPNRDKYPGKIATRTSKTLKTKFALLLLNVLVRNQSAVCSAFWAKAKHRSLPWLTLVLRTQTISKLGLNEPACGVSLVEQNKMVISGAIPVWNGNNRELRTCRKTSFKGFQR